MDTSIFSYILAGLGVFGIIALLLLACAVVRYYHGSRFGSFRWYWRSLRLKQLSALATMFFLAMAASYGVLHDAWALFYIVIAVKTATWQFRLYQETRGYFRETRR